MKIGYSTCYYVSGISGFHFVKKSKFMLLLALSVADWNNEKNGASASPKPQNPSVGST